MIFEVFRQERRGQAFAHAGSIEAPDLEFAEAWAREQYGRRQESEALWVVPREAILEVHDFPDELKRVVTGNGPMTAERLEFRRRFLEQEAWVRDVVLAEAA